MLKQPNTGQYVQSFMGCYSGCCCGGKPGYQYLCNIDVNSAQAQGILSILHISYPIFGSNSI